MNNKNIAVVVGAHMEVNGCSKCMARMVGDKVGKQMVSGQEKVVASAGCQKAWCVHQAVSKLRR